MVHETQCQSLHGSVRLVTSDAANAASPPNSIEVPKPFLNLQSFIYLISIYKKGSQNLTLYCLISTVLVYKIIMGPFYASRPRKN
jgi:hypothetical protein